MPRVFDAPSRARNTSELPWVGDPERWGGSDVVVITTDPAAGEGNAQGNQILRAQTRDLIAVGWDFLCTWTAEGFNDVTDTISVALLVTLGVGQGGLNQILWDCGTLSPAGNTPNPQAVALGWRPFNFSAAAFVGNGGVAISGQPLVACALAASPLVFVSTVGVVHTVRTSVSASCAPRGWAP